MDLLNDLNEAQRAAVEYINGPSLVIAGAGSGKTRVLTYKIAYLLSQGMKPWSIMALTFTNKAAREMKERIGKLVGNDLAQHLYMGTFHSIFSRILRAEAEHIGFNNNFTIYDESDSRSLIKAIVKEMGLDDKKYKPAAVHAKISMAKNNLMSAAAYESDAAIFEQNKRAQMPEVGKIFVAYVQRCKQANAMDFDDLLTLTYQLFREHEDIRHKYAARFDYVLVDEYQDTNHVQMSIVMQLCQEKQRVCAVGDDSQSIYSFRGANIDNILNYQRQFQGTRLFKLEQNYRSTSNILSAANALIENNNGRLGKKLWTDGADGEPISLYCAFNELDEARFVVNRIKTWQDNGGALAECAILYRSNAQSRVLEEALLQASMPYRIYGVMRFFERQEIKDALSYLRLIANRNDDAAFERVVNTPTRGIGDRTLDVVRQTSRDRQLTLWQACRELLQEKALAGRAASALQRFMELIDALAQETADMPLHVQTDRVIKDSGLRTMYEQEKGEKGQTRIENLEELVTATRQFSYNEEDEDLMPLQAFLSHAALEAGEGQADTWQDAVQLMTLHSAKGLEFPQVFIVGMEEGMFPSQMSLDEGGRLEEERRLAYVGVTRAMQKLTLTYAETRRLYGKEVYHRPSRFIGELPEECVEEVRLRATVSRPVSHQRMGTPMVENDSGYKLGQRVRHAKFGEGTIVNMEGSGEHSRLQVAFQGQGIKWLVAAYARLESV